MLAKLPDFKGLDARTRDALLLAWSFFLMAACVTLFVVLIRQPTPHEAPKKDMPTNTSTDKSGKPGKPGKSDAP